jgi:hypothetical protein
MRRTKKRDQSLGASSNWARGLREKVLKFKFDPQGL